MKKSPKIIMSTLIILLTCMLIFTGCILEEETTTALPEITESIEDKAHREIESKLENTDFKTPYSELYNIYESVIAHMKEHQCTIDMKELLTNMLHGEWKDSTNNYITYTYCYEDYNNTKGRSLYNTNLSDSRIEGNKYYYYLEVDETNLIIGYQDNITEEKTDNFVITFNKDSISVYNKNDNITYKLESNSNYDKVQEGNAKMAYIYIAKKIFWFSNPSSINVTYCYVDYEEKIVYFTIQKPNGFGGTTDEYYRVYEINGKYHMTEGYKIGCSNRTNIDLDELKQKLKQFISTNE